MKNLDKALAYLERGLSVIPLWSPDLVRSQPPKRYQEKLNGELVKNAKQETPLPEETIRQKLLTDQCKVPVIYSWTEYQKRLPTKEEVTQWFTDNPSANIGIITGKVSNIVVFDLDSEEAQEYAEAEGGFPDTVRVKTGKGYHIYMRHPGVEIKNRVNKNLAIDIRADGGYVVAPPSIHGSGNHYQWVEGFSIHQIDPAPCTPWMIDYLQGLEKKDEPIENESLEDTEGKKIIEITDAESEYTAILRDGCIKGHRNHTATKLIGHLLKTGLKETELWELLRVWNQQKNKPPMDETELKRTFESIKKEDVKGRIQVDSLLDNAQQVVSEYDQQYVRVPFAGNNLGSLEQKLNGGLLGGRFYLIGGIPSSGKTVLLNCMADNISLNGYPVLIFSYDDGRAELRYRTFARFSNYSIEDFNKRTHSKDVIKAICEDPTMKKILRLKHIVQEMIVVEKWDELIEQIKKKHGKAPVIMIDYLRKLRTEKKISDERLRVDDIISKLTDLTKKHNTPIVAISELARDSYKSGQRLSMASFKESGTIEYEASWLGILAVVEEKNGEYVIKDNWEKIIQGEGLLDLIVYKAKRGTGFTGRIALKLDKEKMTVADRLRSSTEGQVLKLQKQSKRFG